METIYYVAMLEEAHLFEAMNRLVTMFAEGSLAPSPGRAGSILYRQWRDGSSALTPQQRWTIYARAFGLEGSPRVNANRKFEDLWLRFISTVGMFSAELQVLPPSDWSVTQEELRASGHALAVNLSVHGQGLPWFSTRELRNELQSICELLSDAEILHRFGASDMWQVAERLARANGERPNVARARDRAESGRLIIRWLANHANLLARSAPGKVIKENQLRERRSAASTDKQRTHPTDYDLVSACERWLAVTGTEQAQCA